MSRLFFLLLLLVGTLRGQSDTLVAPEIATAEADSAVTLQSINRGPKRALLWSIIPGGGQVYNKKWWKVPLVYGGLLGAVAVLDFNQTRYNRIVTALEARCLGDGNVIVPPFATCQPRPDEFTGVSTDGLVRQRDALDRNRQTAYVGILAVYVLQAVEAYTDAHLRDFDISDDLSLRVGPVSGMGDVGAYAGAGVLLRAGPGRVRAQERIVAELRAR